MSGRHKRAKDKIKLLGNIQERPSKSAVDPNIQLLEGSHNTNTKTLVVVGNTEYQMNIDHKK